MVPDWLHLRLHKICLDLKYTLSIGLRNRDRTTLEGGINRADMSKIAVIYRESIAKQFKSKASLVPVLAAEDETAVISEVTYSQEKDELLGFCGIKGANHQCLDQFTVRVGDGEEGYNTIFSAFRNNVIGSYARAIFSTHYFQIFLAFLF